MNLKYFQSLGELPAGPFIYQLCSVVTQYWKEPLYRNIAKTEVLTNPIYKGIQTRIWSVSSRFPTTYTTVLAGLGLIKLINELFQKVGDWEQEYDNLDFVIQYDGVSAGVAQTSWSGTGAPPAFRNSPPSLDNETASSMTVAKTAAEKRDKGTPDEETVTEMSLFDDVTVTNTPQPEPPMGPKKVFELFTLMLFLIWDREPLDLVKLDSVGTDTILIDSVPGVYMRLTLDRYGLDQTPVSWEDLVSGLLQVMQFAIDGGIWYAVRSGFVKDDTIVASLVYGLNQRP